MTLPRGHDDLPDYSSQGWNCEIEGHVHEGAPRWCSVARRSTRVDFIGLAALVVTALVIARGVQRRTDLLLTVANAVFEVVSTLEARANNQWHRETRGLSWQEKFDAEQSRYLNFLDGLVHRLIGFAYRIEDLALGKNHYNPYGKVSAYSAASWQDDEDELAAAAANSQYDPYDNERYDYYD